MLKYFFSFSSILLFLSACAQPTLYDNKTIKDPQKKEKYFKEDSLLCELQSYEKVPETPINYIPQRRKSGDLTVTDQYGNRYHGTYSDNSGGFARGAAMARLSRMDKLRERVYEYCMNKRNWYKTTEEEKYNEMPPTELEKNNKLNELIDQTKQHTNKGQFYACIAMGIVDSGKLVETKDKNFILKNSRGVTLKKLNGYNFLIDNKQGLFTDLQIKNEEVYSNGTTDFYIHRKDESKFTMVSVNHSNDISKQSTNERLKGAIGYKCFIPPKD